MVRNFQQLLLLLPPPQRLAMSDGGAAFPVACGVNYRNYIRAEPKF
jgi:hypothetical protein